MLTWTPMNALVHYFNFFFLEFPFILILQLLVLFNSLVFYQAQLRVEFYVIKA